MVRTPLLPARLGRRGPPAVDQAGEPAAGRARSRFVAPSTPSATSTNPCAPAGWWPIRAATTRQAVAYAAAVYGVPGAHRDARRRRRTSRWRPPAVTAPRSCSAGRASAKRSPRRWWSRPAACWCRRSTIRTSSRGRAPSAWRSPRTCPTVDNVLDPGQRRRPGVRHRHGDQGAVPATPACSASNPNWRPTRRRPAGRPSGGLVDRGPKPHDRRRPAVTALRLDLRSPAEGAGRGDHRVRERDSRMRCARLA